MESKPVSRILSSLVIYLGQTLPLASSCLPAGIGRDQPQMPAYLALHRLEFSLFTTAELYLVSVPLVLSGLNRRTGVTR